MFRSVSFQESPDGRNVSMRILWTRETHPGLRRSQMVVTFDMTVVQKQDMHVSYRTTRLIVSWRVERTRERREGDTLVRDEARRGQNCAVLYLGDGAASEGDFHAGLGDANWKTRLATLDEMTGWVEGAADTLDSEVVVRFLGKKGWNEKNFQVRMTIS